MNFLKMSNSYWMTDKEYESVTSKTPIPCVDLVILRKSEGKIIEVLLLVRKTGYAKGKWCIIGGRQWKEEIVEETIHRQADDLGIKVKIIPPFESNFPAWVNDNPLQDKTKHPCTSTYPVKIISGNMREEGEEYKGYKWFPVDRLPDEMAYSGHRFQILRTLEQLKKFNGLNEI